MESSFSSYKLPGIQADKWKWITLKVGGLVVFIYVIIQTEIYL